MAACKNDAFAKSGKAAGYTAPIFVNSKKNWSTAIATMSFGATAADAAASFALAGFAAIDKANIAPTRRIFLTL